MKVFMLSLVMLIGVSFAVNAEQNQPQLNGYQDCLSHCQLMYDMMMEGLA